MRQPVRDREGMSGSWQEREGGSSYPSVKQMLKGKNRLFFPFQTFKHAVLAGKCPLKGKICHIFTSYCATDRCKHIYHSKYFANSEKSDTFAFLNMKASDLRSWISVQDFNPDRKQQPARMAESVDALVSNTSGAIRAGSIPAPGTF